MTVQNNDNIDGLLLLAKREILSENYDGSVKYLEEIIVKSTDNVNSIILLFEETELYEIAKRAIESQSYFENGYDIAELLTKFDSENILSWLLMRKVALTYVDNIIAGRNIIRLAKAEEKKAYEKEIYNDWIDHGSQCDAYMEYFNAVPKEYIAKNKECQDFIINIANTIHRQSAQTQENIVKILTAMLPEDRQNEVSRHNQNIVNSNSGACYIATCVYGSYDCPQVWTLRRFRDNTLKRSWYGRIFVKFYYKVSPGMVKIFGHSELFKRFWKSQLDKIVADLNDKGVENTCYHDKTK